MQIALSQSCIVSANLQLNFPLPLTIVACHKVVEDNSWTMDKPTAVLGFQLNQGENPTAVLGFQLN